MNRMHNNKTHKRWSLKDEQTNIIERTEYKDGKAFLVKTTTNVKSYEFIWTKETDEIA